MKSSEVSAITSTLQKMQDETYFQKNTPSPDIERLFYTQPGGSPRNLTGIPLTEIYETAYNSNELRIIFQNLEREIFRNGWEFKPKWVSKCTQCSKEFEYKAETCDTCNYPTQEMSPIKQMEIRMLEKKFKCVNHNGETMRQLLSSLENDLEIANIMFLVLQKEYFFDFQGNLTGARILEFNRGSPQYFSPLMNRQGELGFNESNEPLSVCVEHRNHLVIGKKQTRCACGKQLFPALYRAQYSSESTVDETYYIAGEVISTGKYYPYPGYSPLTAVWNKVTALRAMDLYVKEYYSKQRPPKGLLLVNTANVDELQKTWEWVLKKTKGNPHMIHPLAVQSGSTQGSVAQFIDFMNSLTEAQYVEVRQEFRVVIGAQYGVMPLFQGDTSTSGGLNNEGLQITVTNRAVAAGQEIWNDIVFPRLLKEYGVDDFDLVLLPSEEQDETAEVDRQLKKTQNAQQMQSMGFKVELSHDGTDFVFSGEARDPMAFSPPSPQITAEQIASGDLGQAYQGEALSKAMPYRTGKDVFKELVGDFAKELEKMRFSKESTRAEVEKKADAFSVRLSKSLKESLDEQIRSIYESGKQSVEKDVGKTITWGKPDQNAIGLLKGDSFFASAFVGFEKEVKKSLYEVIKNAYEHPERLSIPTLVGDMQAVVDLQKSRLEMIARTESSFISNVARQVSYAKVDDGTYLYKWIGPNDDRTTDLCKELSFATVSGVRMPELKKMISSTAQRYGFTAREFTPHFSCRHTFVRTLADIQKAYYDEKHAAHGDSAKAVGWKSEESQLKRFDELLKILPTGSKVGVLDVGCGLGHFNDYALKKGYDIHYAGLDVEPSFVKACKEKGLKVFKKSLDEFDQRYDYVVCSGAFNTKGSDLLKAIPKMVGLAEQGVAFNFLSNGQFSSLESHSIEDVVNVVKSLGFKYEVISNYIENDTTVLIRKGE